MHFLTVVLLPQEVPLVETAVLAAIAHLIEPYYSGLEGPRRTEYLDARAIQCWIARYGVQSANLPKLAAKLRKELGMDCPLRSASGPHLLAVRVEDRHSHGTGRLPGCAWYSWVLNIMSSRFAFAWVAAPFRRSAGEGQAVEPLLHDEPLAKHTVRRGRVPIPKGTADALQARGKTSAAQHRNRGKEPGAQARGELLSGLPMKH